MQKVLTGKCIVIGDNIDTDQIYPGRFLAITDPKEIGSHCLCGVNEDIAGKFPHEGTCSDCATQYGSVSGACGFVRENILQECRESGIASDSLQGY